MFYQRNEYDQYIRSLLDQQEMIVSERESKCRPLPHGEQHPFYGDNHFLNFKKRCDQTHQLAKRRMERLSGCMFLSSKCKQISGEDAQLFFCKMQ